MLLVVFCAFLYPTQPGYCLFATFVAVAIGLFLECCNLSGGTAPLRPRISNRCLCST